MKPGLTTFTRHDTVRPAAAIRVGTGTAYTGNQIPVLGSEQYRHSNLLGQKYFEITNNFSRYMPEHTMTFGSKVDLFSFWNLFIPDAFQPDNILSRWQMQLGIRYTF
jgi:hypothetical protein